MKNTVFTILIVCISFFLAKQYFSYNRFSVTTPNFEAILIDGSSFKLSDIKGKFILIDFWASWCGPCRKEIPKLISLQKKYPQKLSIVSIALERDYKKGLNFSEKINFPWKHQIIEEHKNIYLSSLARSFGLKNIPALYLIDKKGNLLKKLSIEEISEILKTQ